MQGLIRALTLVCLTAGLVAVGYGAAYADTKCKVVDPLTGQCKISIEVPGEGDPDGEPGRTQPAGDGGPKDTGVGSPCYFDPSKQGAPGKAGPVPCQSPYGAWHNGHNCYVEPADPPPAAGDPAWQGHEPGDGGVYNCYQPQTTLLTQIWAANPPEGAAAGPSPREVAQMAVEQMNLSAIDIGITPEPGQNSVGLVGMPVWLWARQPDSHTYGPATASASAGGITVTATARVHEITWNMGDGTTVRCRTAGTPYQASYGKKSSPDCGHVYTLSSSRTLGGKYTVTATSAWVITWQGAGQTGTIRLNGLSRSVQITVGEAQVLVR
ncbi:hypothetical protein ACFWQC_03300 [Nocardioides sp. NPDC058538]|uniref:hypothetical protein n=1 Tax=Nocardioides sp. NPDC058538 TaxID=3346542 RepID=UPI00364CEA97